MEINNDNYFSQEVRQVYMGSSEFKEFLKCEAEALARIKGEIKEENTSALMIGSYVDAYFSEEMDDFTKKHPEIYTKQGTLKSDYEKAEKIIKFIKEDELLSKYLSGEHQRIFTGEIAGVPFKIKVDSFFPDKLIVDQKVIKDLKPIWNEEKHIKQNFVEYWGYNYQGAIYQEIVRQNTGQKLPFVLAVATKEEVPSKALLRIDQDDLDAALAEVIEKAPRYYAIKLGKIEPNKCGKCNYCKSKIKLTGIFSYHTLDEDNWERE